MDSVIERRYLSLDKLDVRAADESSENEMIIEGHPILYDVATILYSDDSYELREIILPGAATDALKAGEEVLLWNHDSSQPMARRANGTLQASEDDLGVKIKADVSKTIWGRNGYEAIKNGAVDSMSFGFYLSKEDSEWKQITIGNKTIDIRTIKRFKRIVDYSPVTYPAYKDTDVAARSKDAALLSRQLMSMSGIPNEVRVQSDCKETKDKIKELLKEAEQRSKRWKNY